MNLNKLKTTSGVDVAGKRVLVRADLNVPTKDGRVTDATRLERIVPGLHDLMSRGARVIVLSHFGRPKGGPDPEFTLAPVVAKLGELLGKPVDVRPRLHRSRGRGRGREPRAGRRSPCSKISASTRARRRTRRPSPQALARSAIFYVNDAFSAAHRAHASTDGITRLLPSYAGPLMMEEITALRAALEEPKRPTAAVVGGAKVSTKIPVLTNLVAKVDKLIIGGGMANTFLLAQGVEIGKSLAEPDLTKTALEIMAAAKERGCEIVLPLDVVVAAEVRGRCAVARRGARPRRRPIR